MGRIERLPEDLANKIAAGEVVERPASVVKELVENALDAGAVTVAVELEAGGKALVRVRDDGSGMDRADAERSLERHATSKLRELSDLQRIATHGFRGEALPAIASVGHLVLRTRDAASAAGTEVEVRHGRLLHVRDVGHPRGTTVELRELFGAVPARRKFLRADATESAHVAEALSLLALARPATGFALDSGTRRVLEAPPVEGLAARIYQIFGGAFLDELLPVEGGAGELRVTGFVSRPDRPLPSRASLRLFVNGRPVRDRGLSKAVLEAYRAAGLGDARPEAIVLLEAPAAAVDVNVHPAKSEVRFADPRLAWRAVESAVRASLSAGARERAPAAALRGAGRVEEAAAAYLARPTPPPRWDQQPGAWIGARSLPGPASPPATPAGPRVLGQHRNTYLIASDGDELLLFDQHTAHERVRFEAILARLERRAPESQLLLAPLVLTLPPALRPVLEAHQEHLPAVGFEVEPFGRDSLRVRAVPAALAGRDPADTLQAILRDLLERGEAEWAVAGPRERLAATLACHSAVRAGQPLAAETMAAIVRDLAATAHPTLCPHGRATQRRVPREELSRWFGRGGWRRQ